jgi:N12 class adenine-specific DNA methylase
MALSDIFAEIENESTTTLTAKQPQRSGLGAIFDEIENESPVAERSFLGDTVSHLARGGVELADSAVHALDTAVGGSETLKKASNYLTEELPKQHAILRPDQSEAAGEEGIVKRGWNTAMESTPQSAAVWGGAAAGATAGGALGSVVPVVGTAAGALAGGIIGGAGTMLGLFGLGTYGKQKEDAAKRLAETRPDLDGEQIDQIAHKNAMTHALAEAGGEGAGDIAAAIFFRTLPGGNALYKGGKAILKELVNPGVVKTLAKALAKYMPFEVGSEVGTSYFQNEADKEAGISTMSTGEAMRESIIPAIFLSTGMGVTLGGHAAYQRNQAYKALNDGSAEERADAAKQVAGSLAQSTDRQIAQTWLDTAMTYISAGQPVPLDVHVADMAAYTPDAASAATPESGAPKGPLSKAADMLIGKSGLYGTATAAVPPPVDDPRMAEEWANQTDQALTYNQRRNQPLARQQPEPDQQESPADVVSPMQHAIDAWEKRYNEPLYDARTELIRGTAGLLTDDNRMEGEWARQSRDATAYNQQKNQQVRPETEEEGKPSPAVQAFMRAYNDEDNTPENRQAWMSAQPATVKEIEDRKMQAEWDAQETAAAAYNLARNTPPPQAPKKTKAEIQREKDIARFNESYQAIGTVPKSQGNITEREAAAFEQRVQRERAAQRRQTQIKALREREAASDAAMKDENIPDEVKQSASRQAQEIVKTDPVYQHMAEAKKRGKLNLEAMREAYDSDTIGMINRRYPGILSLVGTVQPDDFANEMGYESLDAMVRRFAEARTQKELTGQIIREQLDEWQRAESEQGDYFDRMAERQEGARAWKGNTYATTRAGSVFPAPDEAVSGMEDLIRRRPESFTEEDLDHWTYTAEQRSRLRAAHREALSGLKTSYNNEDKQQSVSDVAINATNQAESLPRNLGATRPAEITGQTEAFLRNQQVRQTLSQNETNLVSPASDTSGFLRDQQIRRDAVGTEKAPLTRQPGESLGAFLQRRRAEREKEDQAKAQTTPEANLKADLPGAETATAPAQAEASLPARSQSIEQELAATSDEDLVAMLDDVFGEEEQPVQAKTPTKQRLTAKEKFASDIERKGAATDQAGKGFKIVSSPSDDGSFVLEVVDNNGNRNTIGRPYPPGFGFSRQEVISRAIEMAVFTKPKDNDTQQQGEQPRYIVREDQRTANVGDLVLMGSRLVRVTKIWRDESTDQWMLSVVNTHVRGKDRLWAQKPGKTDQQFTRSEFIRHTGVWPAMEATPRPQEEKKQGWQNVTVTGMSSELAFAKRYEQWVNDGMEGEGPPPPQFLDGAMLVNFVAKVHAAAIDKAQTGQPKAPANPEQQGDNDPTFIVHSLQTGQREEVKTSGLERTPKKTASQITKEGGIAALEGVKSAMEGLSQLFGGKNRLGSGLTFDEETYTQAKPHFVKAWNDAKQVGYSLKELIQYLHDQFGKAIRPYLQRFLADVKAGDLTVIEKASTINQVDKKQEQPRGGQDDNIGSAGAESDGQSLRQDGQAVEGAGDRPLVSVAAEVRSGSGQAEPPADRGTGRSGKGKRGNQGTHGVRVPASRGRRGRSPKIHPEPPGTASDSRNGGSGPLTDAPATIPAKNFVITDEVNLGQGGQVQKYRDNIEAIRTLKKLWSEQRRATPDEQRILARYVGWGGIPNAFRNAVTGEVKEDWQARVEELEGLLTAAELETARNSTQNAHYTSGTVVSAMWDALQHLGFKGGLTLEPSVGVGNFIGLVPQELSGSTKFVAAEFDGITAGIAQALYPQEGIFHTPFEKLPLPSGSFDLVIGNPPFGQTSLSFPHLPAINRHSIHNQFFLAGLEALKPGGIQAFVVSRYLMDSKDATVRKEIAKQAELLAAVRLPQSAFKGNALTDVVTDIIILRKPGYTQNAEGKTVREPLPAQPSWLDTVEVVDRMTGEPMTVNAHFAARADMIIGTMDRSGSMRREGDITVHYDGKDFRGDLSKALRTALPKGIMSTQSTTEVSGHRFKTMVDALEIALSGAEEGSISIDQQTGKLMMVREMKMTDSGSYILSRVELTPETPWSNKLTLQDDGTWTEEVDQVDGQGNKVKVGRLNAKEIKRYTDSEVPVHYRLGKLDHQRLTDAVKLLATLKKQILLETSPESVDRDIEANRKELKQQYDAFLKQHKYHLSSAPIARLLASMPDGALVLSLEEAYAKPISKQQAKKLGREPREASADLAAIMSRRVIFPYRAPEKTSDPQDALAITLSETGRVDLETIAELMGKDEQGVIAELHDNRDEPLIYRNPETGAWETADEYLGGNVAQKLNAASTEGLEKNIAALEKIQPEPWGADKVTVMPGATWVPESVYADFLTHLTGSRSTVRFGRASNTFSVYGDDSTGTAKQWNTPHRGVSLLFEALLNSKSIRVNTKDSDGNVTFDADATELAKAKVEEIKEEFSTWVFKDSERRKLLVDLFNKKFNVRVNRQRNGQHLQFPGKVPDQVISLRRHQKNGIWRGIVDRFVLYDHAVGAGKTFTGIARAIERRRMGLSRKPMIVVPNHLVEQFAADVYRLYPGARVLAASKKDLEKSKRRRLFARIATGDWDVVIVPHSSFAFIGIDPVTEARYLEAELETAEAAVREAEEQAIEDGFNGPRKPLTVKQAEALRDKIVERLRKLQDRASDKDRLLTFEQMGVDDLTVDEAHEFKNLFYSSNMQARGMNPRAGSAKAYDLWLKVRVLRETGGSVAFMTGTPISNSAVEMYGLMRYLAADELQDMGLDHFDAWRAQFVDATTEYEPTESGRGLKEVNRLGRDWSNMRALMDLYYSFADSVTNDDIKRWYREDKGRDFPIPRVRGGGRVSVNVQPTPAQENELQQIVAGFEALPDERDVTERNRKRLRLMDQARKVSLDVRAVNPRAQGEPGGKLDVAAQRVYDIYKQWEKDRGTQLVFLDRSVPKAQGDRKILAAYDALREKLAEAERAGDEAAEQRALDALEKYDTNEMEELRIAQAGGWNGYQHLKDSLVSMGIPANEIRFVQEANTDEQKQALFDEVNAGAVRVLIGSTPRMGAGTNVQERLVALHHIDVTWKPSDIEQREGRIIRQGNKLLQKYGLENFEVEILAYTTETTIDAKLWSLNATKLRMINGIRQYKGEFNMEFDDEDSVGMAEIAAIASGNPLQLERVKLDAEIKKLTRQQRAFDRQQWGVKDEADRLANIVETYPGLIAVHEELAPKVTTAIDQAERNAAQRSITIDGKVFGFDSLRQAGADNNPFRYVLEKYDEAKKDNGKFSVNIDGEETRSKQKAENLIDEKLGDALVFDMMVNGELVISRNAARRAIADLANQAMDGKPDDMGEVKVGTVIVNGIEFDLSVETETGRDRRGEPTKEVFFYFEAEVPREDGQAPFRINVTEKGTVIRVSNKVNLNSLDKLFTEVNRKTRNIPGNVQLLQESLDIAKRDLDPTRARASAEFSKADELKRMRERLVEVERELAGTESGQTTGAQLSVTTTVPTENRADIEAELRTSLGGIRTRRLLKPGRVVIIDSQEEMRGVIDSSKTASVKYSKSGSIQGAYVNGTAYLVRDGIEKGQTFPVLLHEMGEHAGRLGFTDDAEYQTILGSLKKRSKVNGIVGDAIRAAMARVPENTKPEHYWSEVAAYLVEDNANTKLSIVDRILSFFRKLLIKAGITSPDTLSHKDLVIFARAAVNAASGGNAAQSAMLSVREMFKSVDPNSPALKRFLGDSQITEPVYHGSPETFWTFDTNKVGQKTHSPGAGLGFFFAMDPNYSRGYAGIDGANRAFYLKVENPKRMQAHQLPNLRTVEEAKAHAKRLQLAGHDGVILEDEGHVVVFEPNQVKSAEINTGEFDADNPDVRYSVAGGLTGNGTGPAWQTPQDSKRDTFLYSVQDKLIDLKRIQDNIEQELGPISEEHDVRMAEELYHKRAAKRTEDMLISEVNPLMKELGEIQGGDLSEFEEYMHALHAPEANESLRLRNPNEEELAALKEQAKADRDRLQESAVVQRFIQKERELATAERDVETGDADDSLLLVVREELNRLREEPIIEQYVKARERHRKIRHAKPFLGDNTTLSGMSNEAAEQVLANLPVERRRQYQELAKKWQRFIAKTRATLVQYELEGREVVEAWAEAFEHYVPLHREDMDNGTGIGQGFSVKGSATRARTGSNRKVVDILAHIVMQREKAIVRGEKAAISKALYGLAAANPNPDVWTIETPPMVREFDPVTGLVISRPDPGYKNKPNAVVHRFVNENGHIEERAVLFNERSERGIRLAEALKNLDVEQLGTILRTSAMLTRWFSAVNTQYNLVFGPVNAIRDAGAALLNLTNTPLAGRQKQVAKRIATSIGPLFKAIWADAKGQPLNTEIGRAWREMQLEGGTTGFRDMFEDADARAKDLKRAMLSTAASKAADRFNWVKQQVSLYNDVMENASRLAVYMEARSQGLSRKRAASLAKNITLNFNRKGKVATQAGAMYAFFNAAVQGTEKLYRTLRGPAGKKILAGGLLLGASQAVLLAAAGFGDDEPKDFIKERSIIVPIGNKKYATIPMPLGFNVIPNLARVATEWALSGGERTGERVASILSSFAETFNPVGNAGFSVQTIAPTVIDPLIALSENKDWTGKNIALPNFNPLKPTPGHSRMKDTASAIGVGLSRALNFLTGGNEYTPGLLSPTPDQIDYLIGQALGGVGRESLKAMQTAGSAFTGEDLPTYKIPLVSRFYGDSADSSATSTAFYRNIKQLNMHAAEVEGLRENRGDVRQYMADNPEARLIGRAAVTYRRVQKLQKMRRDLLRKGGEKERVKHVEARIRSTMDSLNKMME